MPGTKSRRYPDKDAYLLGPLRATMARRAAAAGPDDALFAYPGTDRLWTESEYRNWRKDYFVPIANRSESTIYVRASPDQITGCRPCGFIIVTPASGARWCPRDPLFG